MCFKTSDEERVRLGFGDYECNNGTFTFMTVMQTRPCTISKECVIIMNLYYIDPDTWLAKNPKDN